jgi:glutathione S-transferase
MQGMEPVAIVTVLILAQFFWFAILVGKARIKYEVAAPSVTGHEVFERYFRIHQNTMEQLVVALPALWLFAWYVEPWTAAGLGLVFMLGRAVYCSDYAKDPARRGKGFAIGNLAQTVLLLGALIGPIYNLIASQP